MALDNLSTIAAVNLVEVDRALAELQAFRNFEFTVMAIKQYLLNL